MDHGFVREAALLDQFYPADPEILRQEVTGFIAAASPEPITPRAAIVPHAGYMFSGPVAGTAYAYLQRMRGRFSRVVILGPSHRVAFRGLALSGARAFRTPLGLVALDQAAIAELCKTPGVQVHDVPHQREHCIEVQLPFLQVALGEFSLVPILVGQAEPEQICPILEKFFSDPQTLIVVSSDLSHFLSYTQAKEIDTFTKNCIEQCTLEELTGDHACGYQPLKGLLLYARQHNLKVSAVHLANSFDTAKASGRVVGYGSFILY